MIRYIIEFDPRSYLDYCNATLECVIGVAICAYIAILSLYPQKALYTLQLPIFIYINPERNGQACNDIVSYSNNDDEKPRNKYIAC